MTNEAANVFTADIVRWTVSFLPETRWSDFARECNMYRVFDSTTIEGELRTYNDLHFNLASGTNCTYNMDSRRGKHRSTS